jgi:hypothetical protein
LTAWEVREGDWIPSILDFGKKRTINKKNGALSLSEASRALGLVCASGG